MLRTTARFIACCSCGIRWAGDGPWDQPVSVAVVGDFGLVNAGTTFDRLHQLVEDEEVDFVLHLGDIACEFMYFFVQVRCY